MAPGPAGAASAPHNSDAGHSSATALLNHEELAALFIALKEGGETMRRKALESDAAFAERIRPLRAALEKPFSVAITVERDSKYEGFTYDRQTQIYTLVRYYRPLPFSSKDGVYWFPLHHTREETASAEVAGLFSWKRRYLVHERDTNTGIAVINCEKTEQYTTTGPFRYTFPGRYRPSPDVSLRAVIDCVPVLHAARGRAEPHYTLEKSFFSPQTKNTVSSVTFIENIINVNIISLRIVDRNTGEVLAAEEF
jgi:hypothetical protein